MRFRGWLLPGFALAVWAWGWPLSGGWAAGGIVLDGTLGHSGPLAGPDYAITAELGRQQGGNLFHSFSQFNINAGETATFSGPGTVTNILARVTGGHSSSLDGLLRSTIPGADLFLMNPAGVLFGPHASLDLKGSLRVTTADYLDLGPTGHFAARQPANSVLTVDPPSAFGFLSPAPAAIVLAGSGLRVPAGEGIAIVGGDLALKNGEFPLWPSSAGPAGTRISAPDGRIDIVSVAAAGEVAATEHGLGTASVARFGTVALSGASRVQTSGEGAGQVWIRAGHLIMDQGAVISASALGSGDQGGLAIQLTGNLELHQGSALLADHHGAGQGPGLLVEAENILLASGSRLSAIAAGSGQGGNLTIRAAGEVFLGGSGEFASGIYMQSRAQGTAGQLRITTGNLSIEDSGTINSAAYDHGQGGDVTIRADTVNLARAGNIDLTVYGAGRGGNLVLAASELTLTDGGNIAAQAQGAGQGGSLTFSIDKTMRLAGAAGELPSFISSVSFSKKKGAGEAGSISIDTGSLLLADGAHISSASLGPGNSGDLSVKARQAVGLVDGSFLSTGTFGGRGGRGGDISVVTGDLTLINGDLSASSRGSGQGGNIQVRATGKVVLDNVTGGTNRGSTISSSTFGKSPGVGNGGNIMIEAESLFVNLGSAVESSTYGTGGAGNVTLKAGGDLEVLDGLIAASSFGAGQGGDILVTAGRQLRLGRGAVDGLFGPLGGGLAASAFGQGLRAGNGGNILVQTPSLILTQGGYLNTGTFGPGRAGNIGVEAGHVEIASRGRIFADSFLGSGGSGDITVKAQTMTITGEPGPSRPGPLDPGFTGLSSSTGAGRGGDIQVALRGDLTISAQGAISTEAHGAGRGGSVSVAAQNLLLTNEALISSASTGSGDAGNIAITARDSVRLTNAAITTAAGAEADGGNIAIATPYMLNLKDSMITASVGGGPQTTGGNITIDPKFVILKNSQIIANAHAGTGGNISIVADTMLADPDSRVDASSALGISGTVDIRAPINNVSGLTAPLSGEFESASDLLRERCLARLKAGGKYSSFTVGGRDGLPVEPGGLLPGIVF